LEFKPGWVSTSVTILLVPLFLALGFWQLGRSQQKASLQAAFDARSKQPPIPLTEVDTSDPESQYRRVVATGRYDSRQFLLDNQVDDKQRPGYHVLTPLQLREGNSILVNRGWVPLGSSRQKLPDINMDGSGYVTITGLLTTPANPGLLWGRATGEDLKWPRVIPYVDYRQLTILLSYPLEPKIVSLEPGAPNGYWCERQSLSRGIGPERHQAYAVQWLILAMSIVIIYLVINTNRVSHS
jgi:surfeit locus 1 family protein